METAMIKMVQNRVNEMVKNTDIQKIMLGFDSKERAQNWVIKAAIATLFLSENERKK